MATDSAGLHVPSAVDEAWHRLADRGGSTDDVRAVFGFLARLWTLDTSDPRAFDQWLVSKHIEKKDTPLLLLAEFKRTFEAEQKAKIAFTRELIEGLTLGPHFPGFLSSLSAFSTDLKRFAYQTAISVGRNEDLLFIFSFLSQEDQRLAQEWISDQSTRAQSLNVRMPRVQVRFQRRDLPAALSHSRGHLPAFLGDLLERPPVAIERGFPARQRLPALDDYVHVLGVHRERMPSGNLTLDHVIP